ncbi:MAG: glycyl-radical enzyme activating protein, partial [Mailhella sp.]
LRCRWCSNPESQLFHPERAFNPSRCLSAEVCGRCLSVCPTGALQNKSGATAYERAKCTSCGACVKACPSGAQSFYGYEEEVGNILNIVERDAVFYSRSNGGLTLSGGEALAQPGFALALLREAKRRHIATALETCGCYPTETLSHACELLDELIFDIKSLDTEKHRKFTGQGNEQILANIRYVFEQFPDLPITIRTPVIPGFNDSIEEIMAIRRFIPLRRNITYEALTYHRMGQPKYAYLGRAYLLEGMKADEELMASIRSEIASYERKSLTA